MFPGKTSWAGSSADADWTNSVASSSSKPSCTCWRKGYLTPSPQPKGLSTLLDSCHKAPALQNNLCRHSGWKRTWNNSWEIEVFLQNTMQCSFRLRKCSSFFPKFSPPPLHGCQWPHYGLDMRKSRSSPADSSQASSCPHPFFFLSPAARLWITSHSVILTTSTLWLTQLQYTSTSLTKPNNPHPLTTFEHCCYCNLFFQQQCDTAECLLCPALRIMAFFKAPKLFLGFLRVSWRSTCAAEQIHCFKCIC